jgi:hypothetical protein
MIEPVGIFLIIWLKDMIDIPNFGCWNHLSNSWYRSFLHWKMDAQILIALCGPDCRSAKHVGFDRVLLEKPVVHWMIWFECTRGFLIQLHSRSPAILNLWLDQCRRRMVYSAYRNEFSLFQRPRSSTAWFVCKWLHRNPMDRRAKRGVNFPYTQTESLD